MKSFWSYSNSAWGQTRRGWVIVLVGLPLILSACVPPKVTVTSSPGFQPAKIHRVAILPFQTLSTPQQSVSSLSQQNVASTEIRSQFQLPASRPERGRLTHVKRMKVPTIAAQQITKMVYEALEHRPDLHLVSAHEVSTSLAMLETSDGAIPWKERVTHVGSHLNVDAIIIRQIRTYRERVGTKIGATPAAVGFEVHLVDPRGKKMYWTGEYYEEQRPMNEDFMGFVERGGAFVTAKELAKYGIQKMMKQFPVGGDGSSRMM